MSSEQGYDYSYAQFVQDDIPSLGLFGDSTTASISDAPPYDLQYDCLANAQQNGQGYYNDLDIAEQSPRFEVPDHTADHPEFNAFTTPQLSASSAATPFYLAATSEEAEQLFLGAENLRGQDDELQEFVNIYHSPMGGIEAAQSSLGSTSGIPSTGMSTPNSNLAQRAHLDGLQSKPIDVSFFF